MLSCDEHVKSFITSGPGLVPYFVQWLLADNISLLVCKALK